VNRLLSAAADSGGSSTDFTNPITWVQFGVLGLVALGFIVGKIHPQKTIDRMEKDHAAMVALLEADKDRLIRERDTIMAQRDAVAQTMQEKWIPVVGDFITTSKALLAMLERRQNEQG
jgi:hypothetical protein